MLQRPASNFKIKPIAHSSNVSTIALIPPASNAEPEPFEVAKEVQHIHDCYQLVCSVFVLNNPCVFVMLPCSKQTGWVGVGSVRGSAW